MPAESSSKGKEKDSTKSSKEKEKEAATEETEDESTIAANKAAVAAQTKAATMAAALAAAAAASASGGQQVTTEKPAHYTYLKGFRVDQCALFLQHKCTQHRPYTCFYWHFKNQRRRRPVRKRDGTFNYNPDVYCDKYDEQTGVCPSGDDCPYVHRNAGDTEKRYHLRYYKTAVCIHETDSKGACTKNGVHCAFAHGQSDVRPPVLDVRELQLLQQQQHQMAATAAAFNGNSGSSSSSSSSNGDAPMSSSSSSSSSTATATTAAVTNGASLNEKALQLVATLEKERVLNEDPKWCETQYVLYNYKTEPCRRPPRLCRQGFACPQYHNSRDRRRNPSVHKYRSTPCPQVKQGDDWLEPSVCEQGDACKYCHSRTEQQFHPEIYKSSKCNDMITSGYCPRGPFCAFAHVDNELKQQQQASAQSHRAHSTNSESSSTGGGGTVGSSAPEALTLESFIDIPQQQQLLLQQQQQQQLLQKPIGSERGEAATSKPNALASSSSSSLQQQTQKLVIRAGNESEVDTTTTTASSSPNSSPLYNNNNSYNNNLSNSNNNSSTSNINNNNNNYTINNKNLLNTATDVVNNLIVDTEKEKLKIDLLKQTEMSNKLETLCLQYRQWVEKLTIDANEWKAKYIKCQSEKRNLEQQIENLTKFK